MQLIEKLSDMIEDELDDAEKYIRCAIDKKESYPSLASTFNKLSMDEMTHVNLLHDQVVMLINEYRSKNGNPPEKMQNIYDYIHKRHIEHANEIKILQGVYSSK